MSRQGCCLPVTLWTNAAKQPFIQTTPIIPTVVSDVDLPSQGLLSICDQLAEPESSEPLKVLLIRGHRKVRQSCPFHLVSHWSSDFVWLQDGCDWLRVNTRPSRFVPCPRSGNHYVYNTGCALPHDTFFRPLEIYESSCMQVRTIKENNKEMGNTSSTPSGPSLVTETPALQPVHQGFNPTRQDAQIAGRILMGLRLSAMPGYLPSELALSILAHADYRPRITSFRAGLVNYDCCTGHQPWYLETPMLPPDFRRATSLTLQVRSDDRMDLGQYGANGPDGTYNHGYTWFEMCILRPLRRSGPPVCGGIGGRPFEARMAQTPRGQVDPEQDFQEWDEWLQVKHNGRETWVVRHNSMYGITSTGTE